LLHVTGKDSETIDNIYFFWEVIHNIYKSFNRNMRKNDKQHT
jgi:hypothetical protein